MALKNSALWHVLFAWLFLFQMITPTTTDAATPEHASPDNQAEEAIRTPFALRNKKHIPVQDYLPWTSPFPLFQSLSPEETKDIADGEKAFRGKHPGALLFPDPFRRSIEFL